MGKRTKGGEPPSLGYDVSSITVLTAAEAVRRRPALYLGPERRCSFLVAQAALEPFFAEGARCTRLEVSWDSEGVVQVADDDWSVDTGQDSKGGVNLEQALTYIAPGSRRRGTGLSLVNLMSEWFIFEAHQPARLYRLRFDVAKPRPPETGVATPPWRTVVTFKPDALCVDARTPLTADALIRDIQHMLAAPESWPSWNGERPALSFESAPAKLVLTRGT
ncbi:hypothetical protein ACLESD_04880 [Pyxidicoccus sp. 3LFB2]